MLTIGLGTEGSFSQNILYLASYTSLSQENTPKQEIFLDEIEKIDFC